MFNGYGWSGALLRWVNGVGARARNGRVLRADALCAPQAIYDHLDRDLLVEYVDILRRMRVKFPELFDDRGFLDGGNARKFASTAALKAALLKPHGCSVELPDRKWEFASTTIVILAPGEYSWNSAQLRAWKERFRIVGRVVTCDESAEIARDPTHAAREALLQKVREMKRKYPGHPIVVIGFSVGAKVGIIASFEEVINWIQPERAYRFHRFHAGRQTSTALELEMNPMPGYWRVQFRSLMKQRRD